MNTEANKEKQIIIGEYFVSIQGEGPTMGKPSIFLRTGGCNLNCGAGEGAKWKCDSTKVWKKGTPYTIDDLIAEMETKTNFIQKLASGFHLILTGGEPMLQQKQLLSFLKRVQEIMIAKFKKDRFYVEIETNGTIMPDYEFSVWINQYNISPKLSNSGEIEADTKKIDVLKAIMASSKNFVFKFVISDEADLMESIKHYNFVPLGRIWLMPACSTREELVVASQYLAQVCIEKGANFSPRLQLLIWDKTTGV